MAAPKKNIYKRVEYEKLKKELDSIVYFIEKLDCKNITDDIDEEGVRPRVIAKIEDKIKVTLNTAKEAISIISLIVEKEGNNSYVESKVFVIKACIEDIQFYLESNPVDQIDHREITYESKRGDELTIIVSSSYQQVTDRAIILKKILEILPFIDKIGDKTTNTFEVRGSKEMPYYYIRKMRKEGTI